MGQNDILAGFRKLKVAQIQAAIPDTVNEFANAVTVSLSHNIYMSKFGCVSNMHVTLKHCSVCTKLGQGPSGFTTWDQLDVCRHPISMPETPPNPIFETSLVVFELITTWLLSSTPNLKLESEH